MLFNSYEFIFGFLPIVLIGFFVIASHSGPRAAAAWLALASLFFYGYWSTKAVPLLLGSVWANYFFSKRLVPSAVNDEKTRRVFLYISVGLNLVVLAFFKYANFFIANTNVALRAISLNQIDAINIVLPIGISFFTFTQIAFLVDCYQNKVKERNFIHYLLFVTYFPHLIAGPVLHHSQMMPQFAKSETYRIDYDKLAIGIAIFTIGLSKKLLLADPLGDYADLVFRGVDSGITPMFFMSWFGALAYTFQIYFDFSGYSDMAIGMSLMLGIHLPVNFNSPYKATSIIEFWRRWHMTLSAFLRDYLYIPLGGNRLGKFRRYINLLVTMVLGGLWHGANWTFVLWGAAHGSFLVINHVWRKLVGSNGEPRKAGVILRALSWLITFLSVCFAWVLFKASSVSTAMSIYRGMFGLNGISVPKRFSSKLTFLANHVQLTFTEFFQNLPVFDIKPLLLYLAFGFFICVAGPNVNKWGREPHLYSKAYMRPSKFAIALGVIGGALFIFCIASLDKVSPFLYFQF